MGRSVGSHDLHLSRRRLLGLGLAAGAGVGTVASLGAFSGLARSILSLLDPVGVEPYQRTIVCMGTFVSIAVHDRRGERYSGAVEQAFHEVRAVDALMSTFRPESQISRINRVAGHEPVVVDPRVTEVLQAARWMGEQSDGTFDVTVLPLLRAFGFRRGAAEEETRLPSPAELRDARARLDYRAIDIDAARHAAGLTRAGAAMDLGGIAKGFAVDRAADVLRARGVHRAVINAGGDLRVIGTPGHGADGGCHVGIQDPLRPGRILATLELRDQAIATSGNYEQFIEVGDNRLGHLIDPHSGGPAEPMLSATVVAPTAMQADAASTSAFLLGRKRGSRFILQMDGTHHVFLSEAGESGSFQGPVDPSAHPAQSAGPNRDLLVQASPGITGLVMSAEK